MRRRVHSSSLRARILLVRKNTFQTNRSFTLTPEFFSELGDFAVKKKMRLSQSSEIIDYKTWYKPILYLAFSAFRPVFHFLPGQSWMVHKANQHLLDTRLSPPPRPSRWPQDGFTFQYRHHCILITWWVLHSLIVFTWTNATAKQARFCPGMSLTVRLLLSHFTCVDMTGHWFPLNSSCSVNWNNFVVESSRRS